MHAIDTKKLNSKKLVETFYKGQIISKGLFGVLEFSQKMNERIRRSSKNEFVRSFFGRIREYQKSFWDYLTFRNEKWDEQNKSALIFLIWRRLGQTSLQQFRYFFGRLK